MTQESLPPERINREAQGRQELLPNPVTRRRLVRLGWIAGTLVVLGGQLWILLKLFLAPSTSVRRKRQITVGPAERFPLGSVTHFWKEGFLLVHGPTGFLALSQECTHQKCNVDYLPERNVIFCPCHSAEFSLTGGVLAGPAPRPLDRFVTTTHDGQVLVDTSQRLHLPSSPG